MAKDLGEVIGSAVGRVARDAAQTLTSNAKKASDGPLSGGKGLAAGVAVAALAPLAAKGAGKLAKGGLANPVQKVGDKVGSGVKETVGKKVDEAGGAAGMAKEAGKGLLPGSGGGDGDSGGKNSMPGVGKGRRMPIQQAVDVAVPLQTAYNQWTQFEEWPSFMHRLDRVTQEDDCNVSFKAKIWGISREFAAEIIEQRPDERIKWQVTEGVTHTGVVTFHELADRLTRIQVNVDVDPGSLIEKAGRGMRHAKRAVRADLARFKAYIEMEEEETGAWRGVIEDGEVKSSESSSGGDRSSSRASKSSSESSRSPSGSSRSKSSASGARSRSSSGNAKGSSSRSRSSSGRGSSNGRSTSAKSRSSSGSKRSSNGARASSNGGKSSSSSRKKSGARS